jgi:hypothetical protein
MVSSAEHVLSTLRTLVHRAWSTLQKGTGHTLSGQAALALVLRRHQRGQPRLQHVRGAPVCDGVPCRGVAGSRRAGVAAL